jgi:hypothetical protein
MTFEFMHGTPGDKKLSLQNRGKSMDFGNQIATLMDQHLDVGADGAFRITIGGEADGPAHVRTEPGPIAVTIRDVLSDWSQLPSRLAIRRPPGCGCGARGPAPKAAAGGRPHYGDRKKRRRLGGPPTRRVGAPERTLGRLQQYDVRTIGSTAANAKR